MAIQYLLLAILIITYLSFCLGDCFLALPSDEIKRPNVFLRIGSKYIELPGLTTLNAARDEEITLICKTKFDYFETKRTEITLKCNDYRFESIGINNSIVTENLNCSPVETEFYETELNWCPSTSLAYKIFVNDMVFGAICYNLDNTLIDKIYYTTFEQQSRNYAFKKPTALTATKRIKKFKMFMPFLKKYLEKRQTNIIEKLHSIYWWNYVNYVGGSIFAGEILAKVFESDSAGSILLKIGWSYNLREGNWKRFVNALQTQSNNYAYDVVRGTSGLLNVPKDETNNKNNNETIPLIPTYIWTYLKGRDNNEELLVVAFNSPFYKFFPENDVIFCEDVCHKYAWLESAASTFRYSTFGLMFCCDVNDINVHNYLKNFSNELIMETEFRDIEETTTSTTTTTTEASVDTSEERYKQYNYGNWSYMDYLINN